MVKTITLTQIKQIRDAIHFKTITKMNLPQTSIDAYKSMDGKVLAEHYQRILAAIRLLDMAIYEQIAEQAGFTDKNQVSRRLKELELMELVYKPGTKGLTHSNRQAYHYKLRTPDTVVPQIENHYREGTTTAADYASELIAKTKHQQLIQKDLFNEDDWINTDNNLRNEQNGEPY